MKRGLLEHESAVYLLIRIDFQHPSNLPNSPAVEAGSGDELLFRARTDDKSALAVRSSRAETGYRLMKIESAQISLIKPIYDFNLRILKRLVNSEM